MKGTKQLYSQVFDAFDDVKPEGGWNKRDRHDHSKEQMQWFIDNGCEYHKVCAEPGDLILWDSVSIHSPAHPLSKLRMMANCALWCDARIDQLADCNL